MVNGRRIMSITFKKLNNSSLKSSCVQALLEKILSGELKPGNRLPSERDLATQFGISRGSVNQSIMELESKGFLVIIPRKGTIVGDYQKHPTPQTLTIVMNYGSVEIDHSLFSDLMATRILIENECVRLACKNINTTVLYEMKSLIDSFTSAPENLVENLFQFHYKLTQASGNMVYSMVFKGFEPALRRLMEEHYSLRKEDILSSVKMHQTLLDAIGNKDESLAVQCIQEILNQGINALEKRYS